MLEKFNRLAQANVDHFNNHTRRHVAITIVYGVTAGVVVNNMLKKMKDDRNDDPEK